MGSLSYDTDVETGGLAVNVTFTVYKDGPDPTTGFIGGVPTYTGWQYDATLGAYTTTGPVAVTRTNDPGSYSEALTYGAPSISSATPDGSDAIGTPLTLSRKLTSSGGQVVESDRYFNLTGISYSTSSFHLGLANVNFYATTYGYDHDGHQNKVVDPTTTITRTVYDGQGRVVSTWVGTNDTPTSGYWSPINAADMTMVSSNVYDDGGVGDGNLTETISYPGV